MVDELFAETRKQAGQSVAPVRAAALMRIARVETKHNAGQARITFEMAIEEIRRLARPERDVLLQQARLLSAAVCPDLLPQLISGSGRFRHFESNSLVRVMLEHGHHSAALAFAMDPGEVAPFPFSMIGNLLQGLEEPEARLALLRRAVEAWRVTRDQHFVWLFPYHWKVLPPAEALEVAHDMVRDALDKPDQLTKAGTEEIVITSSRESTIFQLWPVFLHLDAPIAQSLLAGHEQLAAAVRRYPAGMETFHAEAEERRKNASGEACGGGFIMAGNPKDFPYQKRLMQAAKDGDFEPAIQDALDHYREDTAPENPNTAPKEFWQSANTFRTILYRAGKLLGGDATMYLDRIPDPDLRLLAQIELAAALAGLPEFSGPWRFHPSREALAARFDKMIADKPMDKPVRSPDGRSIRCPKCHWRPGEQTRWGCRCRHLWNTFRTAGRCPSCDVQWTVTVCHRCGEVSPHVAWYMQDD
jgi:hypothetical protein